MALFIIIPLSSVITGEPSEQMGVLTIFFAVSAVFWNWGYNVLFDKALLSRGYSLADRSPSLRTLQAIGFEVGFMVFTLPFTMWWLEMNFLQALVTDMGFSFFYVIYGYIYNWCYDKIFPYKRVLPDSGKV
ncbi:PACE efflux transporter [Desulforhopalus vacuolatus]|nr:PACE efflux transporter [Desulforhopalus vacuolatus]